MEIHTRNRAPLGWIVALVILGALLFPGIAHAQEGPDAPTPDGQEPPITETNTSVFLEIEAPTDEPVDKGDTFLVHILVADVENLSAFGFQVEYDPDRIEPVRLDGEDVGPTLSPDETPTTDDLDLQGGDIRIEGDLGQFLADSARGSLCIGPTIRRASPGLVFGVCAGAAPPVCLDGPPGVDGSGRLASILFKSRGGEMTDIALVQSDLVLDDVEPPCDPQEELVLIRILHTQGPPVTVVLKGGGSSSLLLIGVIVVLVVAVAGAGVGGFLLYRRRSVGAA